jgi:hypothetical protein
MNFSAEGGIDVAMYLSADYHAMSVDIGFYNSPFSYNKSSVRKYFTLEMAVYSHSSMEREFTFERSVFPKKCYCIGFLHVKIPQPDPNVSYSKLSTLKQF